MGTYRDTSVSEAAKAHGTTVGKVAKAVGKDRGTVYRWYRENRVLFDIVCRGVAERQE